MLFALAGACLVVAAVAPSAGAVDDDDNVAPPEVFQGNAASQAVQVALTQQFPLVPVDDLFTFIALDGKSSYSPSTRQARASILFPGNGGILGPSLACGTFGSMFPPEFKPILDTCLKYQYPLAAYADDFEPDASTVGSMQLGKESDDISGHAVLARSHAGEDASATDAIIEDLHVLGLPPIGPLPVPANKLHIDGSVLGVDSATAKTDQRIIKGVLTSTASSTLSGVKLVGGLVKLGNVVSTSVITDDGHGKQTAQADLDVSGVTVAGMPAKITNKGLVISAGKNPSPLDLALINQVNQLVKAIGLKITALPTVEATSPGGAAEASVSGLLVELTQSLSGVPQAPSPLGGQLDLNGKYTVSVLLGASGVKGSAASFGSDDEGDNSGVDSSIDDNVGDGFGSFDSGSGFDSSLDGSSDGTGGAGPTIRNPNPTKQALAATNTADNFGDRLRWVYLALMFVVLGVCIAPRLVVPARFPGAKR